MPGSKKGKGEDPTSGQRLISTELAAEISGFSQGHIRHLLRTGEMKGEKLGRDWFTTKEAVREYLARQRKPGPKKDERSGKRQNN
jgi:excisionase family DNA binding protein